MVTIRVSATAILGQERLDFPSELGRVLGCKPWPASA
jgi:hypothetical protein